MKKLLSAIALLAFLLSCNSADSEIKYKYSTNGNGVLKREMRIKNSLNDIEIKMEGTASFNTEGDMITALSDEGYIQYKNKEVTLAASVSEDNKVTVAIEKNGNKITNSSDTGKEITTEAIRHIKSLQSKYK